MNTNVNGEEKPFNYIFRKATIKNDRFRSAKPLIVLIKVVRNVTREFEKMTKAFLPQPKTKSEDDRTDCSRKVLPKGSDKSTLVEVVV